MSSNSAPKKNGVLAAQQIELINVLEHILMFAEAGIR